MGSQSRAAFGAFPGVATLERPGGHLEAPRALLRPSGGVLGCSGGRFGGVLECLGGRLGCLWEALGGDFRVLLELWGGLRGGKPEKLILALLTARKPYFSRSQGHTTEYIQYLKYKQYIQH